ncbi:hypothetical protein JJB07_13945 [Tumebacillus sp. ITR2]|uniref:Uncharacterized protein n=1 Tax=Tumebacillus amylolyticus TaxID=2801339 RepID=A0ABS1JBU9_9BACL|nr:hypothetical protein [Tumebacillus amylolyticus]MBL0387738.1 hypothetical protein [Tumebacillus amylolyticus]
MTHEMQETFDAMQENWRMMQSSDFDSAAEDAERFEGSFYKFIDAVRDWIEAMEQKPESLEKLLAMPELQPFSDELPAPLLLNFETELELIMEGITREQEEKYD